LQHDAFEVVPQIHHVDERDAEQRRVNLATQSDRRCYQQNGEPCDDEIKDERKPTLDTVEQVRRLLRIVKKIHALFDVRADPAESTYGRKAIDRLKEMRVQRSLVFNSARVSSWHSRRERRYLLQETQLFRSTDVEPLDDGENDSDKWDADGKIAYGADGETSDSEAQGHFC